MGRFGNLGQAEISKGGVYFEQGAHLVEIKSVSYVEGRHDEFFCIEAEVKETDSDMRVGTVASQMIKMSLDSSAGNIKAFLAAALEVDDPKNFTPGDGQTVDQFWEQAAEEAIDQGNPMGGLLMHLRCETVQTKAGKPFTKHFWGPVAA